MSNRSIFTFNDHPLKAHYIDNQIWFESKDIAKALGYADYRSVTGLYANYKKEFKSGMTEVVESTTSLNLKARTRIFSLRGVHLIAMFARTPVAEEFRKWVLDILDEEVRETTPIVVKPNREILPKGVYHCRSKYNPYRACVWNGNDMIQVGVFPTIAEAVEAQKQYSLTGEIKRIQKTRLCKAITNPSTVPEHFTKEDIFAHFSMFIETSQMLSFYTYGKSLSLDILAFVQEEASRQAH